MEIKIDNIFKKIFTLLIITTMISIPLLELFGTLFLKEKFFYQEEFLSFISIVCIFFIFQYLFVYKKTNNKLVLSDIFIIISAFFCAISIIFSKNINKSLFGEYGYSETPLQVLAYFSLFFIGTLLNEENSKKIIFNIFIALAITEAIIAFLQNFSLWPISSLFDPSWHIKDHLAFGLTEHCNYFAAISTIFTAICSSKYIYENNKIKSRIFFGLAIITCFSTLFTYTRIGWVGIFSIIFGIFLLEFIIYKKEKDKIIFKKYFKKLLILFLCFVICLLIVGISSGQLLNDLFESAKELTSDFENFGTKRGTIWKVGLSSLKHYPLTGTGFDNYRYSFNIYPEKFGWSQNKGHNEYIHILVTQGIPSGINYLAFTFYCFFFPFKKIRDKNTNFSKCNLNKIFLIALFAYFVQALFNSSVTNVAPYKWILMGFLLPRAEQKNLFKTKFFKKYKKS